MIWKDAGVASLEVLYWPLLEESSHENLIEDWQFGLSTEIAVYELKPGLPKEGTEGRIAQHGPRHI